MRNPDLIPESDSGFARFENNLLARVAANRQAWHIPAERIAELLPAQSRWVEAWANACNLNSRNRGQVREKQEARKIYQALLRPFIHKYIRHNSWMNDSDRLSVEIKPVKKTRTRVPAPATIPVAFIANNTAGIVTGFLSNQQGEEDCSRRAMPFGVCFAEVVVSEHASFDTATISIPFIFKSVLVTSLKKPFHIHFKEHERGKQLYLRVRWVNVRGECGVWSRAYGLVA